MAGENDRTYTNFNLYVGGRPTLQQAAALWAKFGLEGEPSISRMLNMVLDAALPALLESDLDGGEATVTITVKP